MKHRSMITAEADGRNVTITITCDACRGGKFRIAVAHMESLARVLPKICEEVGIDLSRGKTETHVFNLGDSENARAAEDAYKRFVAERKAQDEKG